MLSKSDPLSKKTCNKEDCSVCPHTVKNNICKVRECVYEIKCVECGEIYIGETSRSLHERFKEHLFKYEKRDKESVFRKHAIEKHQSVHHDLTIRILSRCPGDPTLRQATEATYINEMQPSLNEKCEFGHSNISKKRWERK